MDKTGKSVYFLILALVLSASQLTYSQSKIKPSKSKPSAENNKADSGPEIEREEDYYKIISIPVPENVILEVGGMAALPDGDLAICTRRGEVWKVSNPYSNGLTIPVYKRFATGLHEPLGLAYKDGNIYVTQRSELTRLTDKNGDEEADVYDKIYSWPLSGNYHEYSYGPIIQPNGNMLVTLNVGWSNSLGHGVSLVPWRGWMLEITPKGKMTPIAAGMRSPAGYGVNPEGDVFYSENQGDWVGSGRISHVEKGDFLGNAESLRWSHLEGSPLKVNPGDVPNTGEPLFEVSKTFTSLKPPAVWLPHGIFGISTSGLLTDNTQGKFGPYENQMFVGDQGQSKIMRVSLEKVNGQYQGVVFPFREGFSSGILRMVWGNDASMFVGMTSRGWSSTGKELYSLQRVVWSGKIPFEMKTVRAMPDGFELEFTQPVNRELASNADVYKVTGFNYKYHSDYGSPVIHQQPCPIRGVVVSEDGLKARLVVDGLRLGYIHEIGLNGIVSQSGKALLHSVGYYTLNEIPKGEKLSLAQKHYHESIKSSSYSPSKEKKSSLDETSATTAKRVTKKPSSWKDPDYIIPMSTKPGLKFNPEQFQVRAGSKVKLIFKNNDDMLHNFVVVLPGTAIQVGEMAMKLGLEGQQKNYIPETDKVLFYANLLQPNTSETIYFTAPQKPGEYTYECSVPGHFYSMQGIMKVVK